MNKKKTKNIEADIMKKIEQGEIKVQSKLWQFITNFFLILGASFSLLTASFFINLIIYQIQSNLNKNCYFLKTMVLVYVQNPPIITIVSAIVFITLAVFLIKRFGFNYRQKTIVTVFLIAFLVLILGVSVSQTSFNQRQKGKWRWVYCQLNEQDCGLSGQNQEQHFGSCKRK